MSDCDRVLDAARHRPVNTADFLLPRVLDGGKPITRVPARINDLQTKRGHRFSKRTEKNRTATYTLVYDAERGSRPTVRKPTVVASPEPTAALGGPDEPPRVDTPPLRVDAGASSPRPSSAAGAALFDPDAYPASPTPHWQQEAA